MDTATSALAITAGLVTRPVIAAEIGVGPRTIVRYEVQGMPAIHLGRQRFYDIAKVRAWVLGHERRPAETKLGRPRRAA